MELIGSIESAGIEIERPRIIVALDFSSTEEAFSLIEKLNPALCRLKIGTTLFLQLGPSFVEDLMNQGFSIFLDLKFHDIPFQVASSCRAAAELGVWMLTIHTMGGVAMCEAAANSLSHFKQAPHLVGVTLLTSHEQKELNSLGIQQEISSYIIKLAHMAEQSGLDGIVCSPQEVGKVYPLIKNEQFLFVTPGIRFSGNTKISSDDQKRIATPEAAFRMGSSYIVIGRPITQDPNPESVLQKLNLLSK